MKVCKPTKIINNTCKNKYHFRSLVRPYSGMRIQRAYSHGLIQRGMDLHLDFPFTERKKKQNNFISHFQCFLFTGKINQHDVKARLQNNLLWLEVILRIQELHKQFSKTTTIDFPQISWIRHSDLHILTVGRYTYTADNRYQSIYNPTSDQWILQVVTWTNMLIKGDLKKNNLDFQK